MRLIAPIHPLLKKGLWNIVFFSLGLYSYAQQTIPSTPKTYIANYTNEAIKIDGLENETSWKNAQYSDTFIDIEGVKTPKYKTQVKMLWDRHHIYFFAQLEEPHVWGTLKKRDTIIYHNNDFEIFIDPDGDAHNYYEFEFNALNTLWDLFITRPYRNGALALNDWEAKGIKSAIHVDGTLNNPNDIDKSWSIEVAIPLKVFNTSYYQTIDLKDKYWRVNFSRVHWDFQLEDGVYQRKKDAKGKHLPEYNWVWSPQNVVAMHQPETWGYVYFSKEGGNFTIPKDEHIKWYLFELHNALKSKSIEVKNINNPKQILNKTITPKYEVHKTGYNIWVESPFSNKTIIINQHGKIIVK
ncbi:carbohydrate-binding family 9-like protein [Seonamhaeicola sp. S2-3]|uniref:carbohydrate-binding family 9-like protein n=1 Tax=Seonamhaeicola sp. S2-3 TaxID=1936081 RepID=UPI000972A889|nr:carbohydrate-binding family 9-like protein [Seonamhaeicola sp. S2-3]APY11540.1 carbohydrate-binding family 9-like protein [Seonamhaeicola sp. S2-3]